MSPALSLIRLSARTALASRLLIQHPRRHHIPTPALSHALALAQTLTTNAPRGAPHRLSSSTPPAPPRASNWNAANALTVLRLGAAPLAAHLILADAHGLALATVAAAGATDAADGWLARRYALHTTLGSYLDPAADKLLVACCFGALAYAGTLPLWLAAVVVGRDVVLIAAAGVLTRGKPGLPPLAVQPLPISKVNTGLQIALTVAGIAYGGGGYGIVSEGVVDALCVATAGTTVASLATYGYHVWPLARRRLKL